MSQPKNRRRAARRLSRAQREAAAKSRYGIHVLVSGALRNPLGKVSSLDRAICVGFGSALVLRDGEVYEDCDSPRRRSIVGRLRVDGEVWQVVTLRSIERHIRRMRVGRHKWSASVDAPLWSAKWERQRPGKWVCVEAGEGFA